MSDQTLDDFLNRYGKLLSRRAVESLDPLHVPGRDLPIPGLEAGPGCRLARPLFPAQAHVATAIVKGWQSNKGMILCAEMGCGKTIISIASVNAMAKGRPYRAGVMCPDHLIDKWAREIAKTVPGAVVRGFDDWKAVHAVTIDHRPPEGPEWWVIGRDQSKFDPAWRPAVHTRRPVLHDLREDGALDRAKWLTCPKCGGRLIDAKTGLPTAAEDLARRKRSCWLHPQGTEDHPTAGPVCGHDLWQYTARGNDGPRDDLMPPRPEPIVPLGPMRPRRWAPARMIHKASRGKRRKIFDTIIIDECFPGSTPIEMEDGTRKRIDAISPGDRVKSRDARGRIVFRAVARVIRKAHRSGMVRVTHEHGHFDCTPNHKIATTEGYRSASILTRSNLLIEISQVGRLCAGGHNADHREELRDLLQAVPMLGEADSRTGHMRPDLRRKASDPERAGSTQETAEHGGSGLRALRENLSSPGRPKAHPVLRQVLLLQEPLGVGCVPREDVARHVPEVRETTRRLVGSHASPERNPGDARTSHEERGAVEGATVRGRAWGQWEGDDQTPSRSLPCSRFAVEIGVSRQDGQPVVACGRDRHRASDPENRDRGGRQCTPGQSSDGPGFVEGLDAGRPGMDRPPVQESPGRFRPDRGPFGDRGGCGISRVLHVEVIASAAEFVWDLEVEDTHCYFAAGVLVSNCHEEKSSTSAQGTASGKLIASSRKVLLMTGTLVGGYAWHILANLYRISPGSMRDDGFKWGAEMAFSRQYGRVDTIEVIKERPENGRSHSHSMGKAETTKRESIQPGIMPTLFGDRMLEHCVFLSLDEVADALPPRPIDEIVPVGLPPEMQLDYDDMCASLMAALAQALARDDKRLLGKYIRATLEWPDYPWGWTTPDEDTGFHYLDPFEIPAGGVPEPPMDSPAFPKEAALVADCKAEAEAGRKVWVYVQMTKTRNVVPRLTRLLEAEGLTVGSLGSEVTRREREAWIRKKGPALDVAISHPKLVETGMELFAPECRVNFPSIFWFQTGYNPFTLRQASRRSWRIGQEMDCRVRYYYYHSTMQDRCMALMGKKIAAAESMDGKFSAQGMAALGGEDSMELQIARSLTHHVEPARRQWSRAVSMAIRPPSAPNPPRVVVATTMPPHPVVARPARRGSRVPDPRQLDLFS